VRREREKSEEGDRPFCDDDRNVAPNVEIVIGICCVYLDVGVLQGLLERFPEDWMISGVEC
jgi:hypothetical protein